MTARNSTWNWVRFQLRIGLALGHQYLGTPGIAGLALLVLSGAAVAVGWSGRPGSDQRQSDVTSRSQSQREAAPVVRPAASEPATSAVSWETNLPSTGDVTALLGKISQAAGDNGLPWNQADYRIVPSSDGSLAALEVRCALKGPYPSLRRMLADLRQAFPAMSLRAFVASRPNAGTQDVEAKLTLAIFLRDQPRVGREPTTEKLR